MNCAELEHDRLRLSTDSRRLTLVSAACRGCSAWPCSWCSLSWSGSCCPDHRMSRRAPRPGGRDTGRAPGRWPGSGGIPTGMSTGRGYTPGSPAGGHLPGGYRGAGESRLAISSTSRPQELQENRAVLISRSPSHCVDVPRHRSGFAWSGQSSTCSTPSSLGRRAINDSTSCRNAKPPSHQAGGLIVDTIRPTAHSVSHRQQQTTTHAVTATSAATPP